MSGTGSIPKKPRMRASQSQFRQSFRGLPVPDEHLAFPAAFSHAALFHPLGFPVRVLSNSPAILAAAEQSWSCFGPLFDHEPLEVRVGVKFGATHKDALPSEPEFAIKGSLLVNVADSDNFIVSDLKKGRAMGWVTEATAASPLYLRYHYIEAAALSLIASVHAVALHGACVRVGGAGVLLCGESGAGKTTLSYAGARSGWTYVSDDASYLPIYREDRLVVGNCHQVRFRPSAAQLFQEVARRPITPRATGKPSIEVRIREWPTIKTATSAEVDHIVFLNRKGGEQRLVPLSAAEVRSRFQMDLIPNSATLAAREMALSRLLTATVSELR